MMGVSGVYFFLGMFGGDNVVVDKYKRILAIYRCFLLYTINTIIGVINSAKRHDINRRMTIVPINKPKKTLCLQYDKPSIGVCKHNAIIKGCKFGRFLKFRGVLGCCGCPGYMICAGVYGWKLLFICGCDGFLC